MQPAALPMVGGMNHSGRRCLAPAALFAMLALACGGAAAQAGEVLPKPRADAVLLPAGVARGRVETVHFGDQRGPSVRLVRGTAPMASQPSREVVTFGTGRAEQVTIVRGIAAPLTSGALRQAALTPGTRVEKVTFSDEPPVTVVRGSTLRAAFSVDLFGPASAGELDRIAFAVDGVESRHGADPRMWRPEPNGPQGPMQVSAAAALDVGGGDRFDLRQNRLLGRAYLAQMYQRYGNWPDALSGYNWGPGNTDQWIAAGRPAERLPLETVRYIERVLRDALITTASRF
jgi:hypothetical protein